MSFVKLEVTKEEKSAWINAAKPGKLDHWIRKVLRDEVARLKGNQ